MNQIHGKSKKLEVAKIHYMVIGGLSIFLRKKNNNTTKEGFQTPTSCKCAQPSLEKNWKENIFYCPLEMLNTIQRLFFGLQDVSRLTCMQGIL